MENPTVSDTKFSGSGQWPPNPCGKPSVVPSGGHPEALGHQRLCRPPRGMRQAALPPRVNVVEMMCSCSLTQSSTFLGGSLWVEVRSSVESISSALQIPAGSGCTAQPRCIATLRARSRLVAEPLLPCAAHPWITPLGPIQKSGRSMPDPAIVKFLRVLGLASETSSRAPKRAGGDKLRDQQADQKRVVCARLLVSEPLVNSMR